MKQAPNTCSPATSRTDGGLESNYYFGLCNQEAGFITTQRGGGVGGAGNYIMLLPVKAVPSLVPGGLFCALVVFMEQVGEHP